MANPHPYRQAPPRPRPNPAHAGHRPRAGEPEGAAPPGLAAPPAYGPVAQSPFGGVRTGPFGPPRAEADPAVDYVRARPKGPRWVTVALVTLAYAASYLLAWFVLQVLS